MKSGSDNVQNEIWASWAHEFLRQVKLGAWGAITPEEYTELLLWPVAFSSLTGAVFHELRERSVPAATTGFQLMHEIKVTGFVAKQPDFAAKYLRWIFHELQVNHASTYGLDEVLEQIEIREENVADLISLSDRLLVINVGLGDALRARIEKWQHVGMNRLMDVPAKESEAGGNKSVE